MSQYKARDTYQNERVAEVYDAARFAGCYGRFYNQRELDALDVGLTHVKSGSRVLDLACGTGRISERLIATNRLQVVGMDISFAMLELARKKLGCQISLLAGEAERFPFADGSFDWVVSVRLFGHLPPPVRAAALAEVSRVVRHGAIIAFYLLNPITRVRRFVKSLIQPNPHWHPASREQIVAELAARGLKVVEIHPVIPLVDQAHVFVATKGV